MSKTLDAATLLLDDDSSVGRSASVEQGGGDAPSSQLQTSQVSFRTPILARKRYLNPRDSENSMSSIQFISDAGAFANWEDTYESVSTSAILRYCKHKVLRPYFRLLSILGWRPLISQATLFENALWARVMNWCYSALILSLISTGYVLQYSSCYRQDGYRPHADPVPDNIQVFTNSSTPELPIKPALITSVNLKGVDGNNNHNSRVKDGNVFHANDGNVFHANDGKVNNSSKFVTPVIHLLHDGRLPREHQDLEKGKYPLPTPDRRQKKRDTRTKETDEGTKGVNQGQVKGDGKQYGSRNHSGKRDSTRNDRHAAGEMLPGETDTASTTTVDGVLGRPVQGPGIPLGFEPKCRGNFFALYLVPSILHFFAYMSMFYLMRTPDCEKLQNLMERGFLETTRTTGWMLAHRKLVNSLRSILWMCLGWLLLSATIHGFIMYTRIMLDDLNMTWLRVVGPTKIIVVIFTVTCLTFNDLICGAIVTSYAVHCQLNISYIHNLCASIREKRIDFAEFYKRIEESRKFIKYLNHDQALGLSLLQITVGCKLGVGVYAFLASSEFNYWSPLTVVIVLLSLFFWSSLFAVPFIQGIRLTAACSGLQKIGHELRSRPFGYQDTPQQDLDSLLLYTTNLSMSAKIMRIPVKSSCVLIIITVLLVAILMLGQLGLLNI